MFINYVPRPATVFGWLRPLSINTSIGLILGNLHGEFARLVARKEDTTRAAAAGVLNAFGSSRRRLLRVGGLLP